ncbi:CaiB/BaiF CoA-transferase family protein [uncultured Nocardioides sp.]|uniref:Alpha-methylacyl-CoA racemase n=1 Tax=uncultured Nocardioides sp. TaxID=198441 RepID=A0A6J4NH03_9ACTN|nr:CaiB/BaiF CoA-transferase family protein [uncultured Nocardioides sp.]CAA9384902.1 MAG: Alpha-methylacyl-CoA racemase [uncultured Nocardioides sp.]
MEIELGRGTGPLRGVRVVELAGIGPGPHACMLMADLGADVVRVDRPGGGDFDAGAKDVLNRGRPSVALDLKRPEAVETVLALVETADMLVEGLRPGTTERLGLGPEACLARNPRLVYGRMTGWGQDGPLAHAAGHDLDYVAVTGALFGLGQDRDRPHFPANLLGDFGGGSTYLVVDGTAHLNAIAVTMAATGLQREERASGLLDGGTPYYDVYETADGRHMAVGALEPRFWAELVRLLALDLPDRDDPANHPVIRAALTARFAERTQAEWVALLEGTDACVACVLPLSQAPRHPHLAARGTFVEADGITQPAPAPRFSRTPATLGLPPAHAAGAHTSAALTAWGIEGVDALLDNGTAVQA